MSSRCQSTGVEDEGFESNTVLVQHAPKDISEADLRSAFSSCGQIIWTSQLVGNAFLLRFANRASAVKALEFNMAPWKEQTLSVSLYSKALRALSEISGGGLLDQPLQSAGPSGSDTFYVQTSEDGSHSTRDFGSGGDGRGGLIGMIEGPLDSKRTSSEDGSIVSHTTNVTSPYLAMARVSDDASDMWGSSAGTGGVNSLSNGAVRLVATAAGLQPAKSIATTARQDLARMAALANLAQAKVTPTMSPWTMSGTAGGSTNSSAGGAPGAAANNPAPPSVDGQLPMGIDLQALGLASLTEEQKVLLVQRYIMQEQQQAAQAQQAVQQQQMQQQAGHVQAQQGQLHGRALQQAQQQVGPRASSPGSAGQQAMAFNQQGQPRYSYPGMGVALSPQQQSDSGQPQSQQQRSGLPSFAPIAGAGAAQNASNGAASANLFALLSGAGKQGLPSVNDAALIAAVLQQQQQQQAQQQQVQQAQHQQLQGAQQQSHQAQQQVLQQQSQQQALRQPQGGARRGGDRAQSQQRQSGSRSAAASYASYSPPPMSTSMATTADWLPPGVQLQQQYLSGPGTSSGAALGGPGMGGSSSSGPSSRRASLTGYGPGGSVLGPANGGASNAHAAAASGGGRAADVMLSAGGGGGSAGGTRQQLMTSPQHLSPQASAAQQQQQQQLAASTTAAASPALPLSASLQAEAATTRTSLLQLLTSAHAFLLSDSMLRFYEALAPVAAYYDHMHDLPVVQKRRCCAEMAFLRDQLMADAMFAQMLGGIVSLRHHLHSLSRRLLLLHQGLEGIPIDLLLGSMSTDLASIVKIPQQDVLDFFTTALPHPRLALLVFAEFTTVSVDPATPAS